MDLIREINEDIYLHNGFRIFNLPITAGQRKVKKEFDNVDSIKQLDGLGPKDSLDVYDNLPFPINPKPNYIDYQNAKNRLIQSRKRLIDEIFWFWPEDLANKRDPTISALKKADVDEALSIWESSSASNAEHNLAVYNHILAIDNEHAGDDNYWKKALSHWYKTLSNNDFKNLVLERVIQLNDPTMREDYVEEIFRQLPVAVLSINAALAKDYLKINDISNFDRHFNLIINSSFDENTKQDALKPIFDNLYDVINDRFEEFENGNYETESDFSKIEKFLDEVEGKLGLLKTYFSSNFQYQSLSDNIAQSITNNTVKILMNMFNPEKIGSNISIRLFDFKRIENMLTRTVDMAYGYDIKQHTEEQLFGFKIINFKFTDSATLSSAKEYSDSMQHKIEDGIINDDTLMELFAKSLYDYVSSVYSNSSHSELKEIKNDLIELLETAKKYAVELNTKNNIDRILEKIKQDNQQRNKTEDNNRNDFNYIQLMSDISQKAGNSAQEPGDNRKPGLGIIICIIIIILAIGSFLFMV